MSDTRTSWKAEREALEFQQRIRSRVRHFPPNEFAPALARRLRQAFGSVELARQSPPHFILHAIEANCYFYRSHYKRRFEDRDLALLMNTYNRHYDPVSRYTLQEIERLDLFMVFLFRQQLSLQRWPQKDDIGRAVTLFDETNFPRSVSTLRRVAGFGFDEWIRFWLGLWAGVLVRDPPIIGPSYYLNAQYEFLPPLVVSRLFDCRARSQEEVGKEYRRRRDERGQIFDLFLPSQFLSHPLLRFSTTDYLVPHPPALLSQAVEGIFDLCREGEDTSEPFKTEFSPAFERYVERVLAKIPNRLVVPERDIQRCNGRRKACDFVVVGDGWIILVECKATEYSSMLSTENAIARDNSTTKVARGIEQLIATAEQISSGLLHGIIGDAGTWPRIAVVVTYRPIVGVNSDNYWKDAIAPRCSDADGWDRSIAFRPQVMDVSALEMFVRIVADGAMDPIDLVGERVAGSPHVHGEWETFLRPRLRSDRDHFALGSTFDAFMERLKAKFSPDPGEGTPAPPIRSSV